MSYAGSYSSSAAPSASQLIAAPYNGQQYQQSFTAQPAALRPDFSAPVIHFGTARDVQPRQPIREEYIGRAQEDKTILYALTKEQKLLSFYLGDLPDEFDDYWVERMLKVEVWLVVC